MTHILGGGGVVDWRRDQHVRGDVMGLRLSDIYEPWADLRDDGTFSQPSTTLRYDLPNSDDNRHARHDATLRTTSANTACRGAGRDTFKRTPMIMRMASGDKRELHLHEIHWRGGRQAGEAQVERTQSQGNKTQESPLNTSATTRQLQCTRELEHDEQTSLQHGCGSVFGPIMSALLHQ